MFNFEKLDIWQKAIDFADLIYNETRPFPAEERFGLTDFARFIEIAAGSVFETVSQAFVARRQNLLSENNFRGIYSAAEEQSRMLSGLRRSLLNQE